MRAALFTVLALLVVAIGIARSAGWAEAATPRVAVTPRVAGASAAAITVGGTIEVDLLGAPTSTMIDAARIVIETDPGILRYRAGRTGPAFDLLLGVREGPEPGRVRLEVGRTLSPWPSAIVTLGTVTFVATAPGTTTVTVVTAGTGRTRVAGDRREVQIEAGTLHVTVAAPGAAHAAAPPPSSGASAPATRPSVTTLPVVPAVAPTVAHGPAPVAPATGAPLQGWGPSGDSPAPGAFGMIPVGYEPGARPIDQRFEVFYAAQAGMRLLGRPMGDGMGVSPSGATEQYFEKGRLEYHAHEPEGWRFQLGLLVDELIALMAAIPIGGDSSSLTYASLARLRDPVRRLPAPDDFGGGVATLADGSTFIPFDAALAPAPGHAVPERFWQFLNDPSVFPNGWLHDAGLPISPVAEAVVTKGMVTRRILVQAFQRTVLTYDPENPGDYQVECANVGTDFLKANGGPR